MPRLSRVALCALALSTSVVPSAMALPPASPDAADLLRSGRPVVNIPAANRVEDVLLLDDEHVVLSMGGDHRYLLTLNRACLGLRWARHVGVTVSDNTIWAGFDRLTADGQACSIREIHLVTAPPTEP